MGRRLVVAVLVAAWLAPASFAASVPRIVYAADWSGPTEIFAIDPNGRAPIGQLTSGKPAARCSGFPSACGYGMPLPSPDGRRILFRAAGIPSYNLNGTPGWVAAADGTGVRELGPMSWPAWSPDSTRIAYVGTDGIHVVRADGSGDRTVDRRRITAYWPSPLAWSPRGDALAFVTGTELVVLRGGHERVATNQADGNLSWSPEGRWLAFTGGRVKVAEVSASAVRVRPIGVGGSPTWAPDRAALAYVGGTGIRIADPRSGRSSLVVKVKLDRFLPTRDLPLAWSPGGRLLAYVADGTRVVNVATRRARLLTKDSGSSIAWSPDGGSLAYLLFSPSSNQDGAWYGGLRLVTLKGRVSTVAAADRAWGGQVTSFAWTTPPATVRYRAPEPVDGAFAGGPVQWLTADGNRVTWSACKQFWAWAPSQAAARRVDPENGNWCEAPYSRGYNFGFAVAGDRLVWGEKGWGLGYQWTVSQRSTTGSSTPVKLASGYGTLGSTPSAGMGTFQGSGSLLVLSTWQMSVFAAGRRTVASQTVQRVEPDGTLTPLSSTPGPYVVMDVDRDRIVVAGDNETRVLDRDGRQLLSVPVSPVAAQLDAHHLVVLVDGALRDYVYPGGTLLQTWPLPAVPLGRPCSIYGDPTCPEAARLVLHDAAYGLAAYVLDGYVHLLLLTDGNDEVVATGTAARFFEGGLAYADGARVHVLPL
jgi:Tol biopolymer transport system component